MEKESRKYENGVAKDKDFIREHQKRRLDRARNSKSSETVHQHKTPCKDTEIPISYTNARSSANHDNDQSKNTSAPKAQVRPKVINMSRKPLTEHQISLLIKGPNSARQLRANYLNIKADN